MVLSFHWRSGQIGESSGPPCKRHQATVPSCLVSSCAHALGVPSASDVACSRFEVPEVVRMRQGMFPTFCALPGRARVFALAGVTAVPPNPWVRFGLLCA